MRLIFIILFIFAVNAKQDSLQHSNYKLLFAQADSVFDTIPQQNIQVDSLSIKLDSLIKILELKNKQDE